MTGRVAPFVKRDVVIEFQARALLPFKRRQHPLVLSTWTAREPRHIGESHRRRTRNQFGHRPVKRTIDYHTQRAILGLMLGNEKDRTPKVRVDHIRMSDQQRAGKIVRSPFIAQITHPRLETARRACATSSVPLTFEFLFNRRARRYRSTKTA